MSVFFFKQKTAYEMRISDWSSDVCSSDLAAAGRSHQHQQFAVGDGETGAGHRDVAVGVDFAHSIELNLGHRHLHSGGRLGRSAGASQAGGHWAILPMSAFTSKRGPRSEEHTSVLQSLMSISYAVFGLKKQTCSRIYVT